MPTAGFLLSLFGYFSPIGLLLTDLIYTATQIMMQDLSDLFGNSHSIRVLQIDFMGKRNVQSFSYLYQTFILK